jgi:hypothetical protein
VAVLVGEGERMFVTVGTKEVNGVAVTTTTRVTSTTTGVEVGVGVDAQPTTNMASTATINILHADPFTKLLTRISDLLGQILGEAQEAHLPKTNRRRSSASSSGGNLLSGCRLLRSYFEIKPNLGSFYLVCFITKDLYLIIKILFCQDYRVKEA